jgi:hypothetical protein
MHPRSAEDSPEHLDAKGATPASRAKERLSAERVRLIRQRIADDAYRSAHVANYIALRILVSRDL